MEKEVSEAERKVLIRQRYLEKIGFLLSKDFFDQKELYSLIKGFFSDFLKLEYEFTYEELSQELNKVFIKPAVKKDIDDFLYSLSESEYFGEKELEHSQIKDYIKRLSDIVNNMPVDTEILLKKPTFMQKIFGKKGAESQLSPEPEMFAQLATVPAITDEGEETNFDISPAEEKPTFLPQLPAEQWPETSTAESDKQDVLKENEEIVRGLFADRDASQLSEKSGISDEPGISDRLGLSVKAQEEKPSKSGKSEKKGKQLMDKAHAGKKSRHDAKEVSVEENQLFVAKEDSDIPVAVSESLMEEDNKPELVKLHELMEESYFNISYSHLDIAKENYLKALDIYHKLDVSDKKEVYLALYELFRKLKAL